MSLLFATAPPSKSCINWKRPVLWLVPRSLVFSWQIMCLFFFLSSKHLSPYKMILGLISLDISVAIKQYLLSWTNHCIYLLQSLHDVRVRVRDITFCRILLSSVKEILYLSWTDKEFVQYSRDSVLQNV